MNLPLPKQAKIGQAILPIPSLKLVEAKYKADYFPSSITLVSEVNGVLEYAKYYADKRERGVYNGKRYIFSQLSQSAKMFAATNYLNDYLINYESYLDPSADEERKAGNFRMTFAEAMELCAETEEEYYYSIDGIML
jgi:hypothetical protein